MNGRQRGTLYLCATPIGNLEDVTLRVLRVLQEVDFIAAEDTRRTRKLLAHYGIHTRLISYHEHNRRTKGARLLNLLQEGKQVALVTDAGLPGISDPGEEMVALALANGIKVVPVPGPNAALTALVASGLPAGRFSFEGFLPVQAGARMDRLQSLKEETRTLIFYEAPHRLQETLQDLLTVLGDRKIAVARELTKVHEEIWRGNLSAAPAYFQNPRGEFTLVVAGAEKTETVGQEPPSRPLIAEKVAALEAGGRDRRQAIKEAARLLKMSRREVYSALVQAKEKQTPE
ncbi:MAG: 16S rRNA (cytidine(1402)-2'-O)-methyltransferase [Bacillota bacterium]